MKGIASVSAVPGSPGGAITGTVNFIRQADGTTSVEVNLRGFSSGTDGPHGMHVLTYGDLRGFIPGAGSSVTGGLSGGGHYDPENTRVHACEDEKSIRHHRGDLGNWNVVNGVISQTKTNIPGLNLTGVDSIIGRMVSVTASKDDCSSLPDGKSGGIWAVGVIGITSEAGNMASSGATETSAVCVFQGTENRPGLGQVGLATLEAVNVGGKPQVLVKARVMTGDRVPHGFHAHQFGEITDMTSAVSTAGPHYNKHSKIHGLPNVPQPVERHAGDFGSIRQYDDATGNAHYELLVTEDYMHGDLFLTDYIGRALIIHERLDYGNGVNCPSASVNGNSGVRYFVCVVGVMNPPPSNATANFALDVPTLPVGFVINKTYTVTDCVASPTNGGSGNVPTTNSGDQGLTGGQVVGILIGVIIFVALVVGIIAYLFIKSGACSRGDASDNYSKL